MMDPRTLIWCVVCVSALLGLTPFNHYGEGWDEQVDFAYGRDAAEHFRASASYWDDYGNLKYYGPAYLMLAHSAAIHLKPLIPGWHISDARHFVNHLTFQVATLVLFYLCLRYVSGWSALVAALLFHTQPLLFGHSFINQKDVPFLASFVLSVWLGFKLADLKPRDKLRLTRTLRQDWARTPRGRKLALMTTGALTILAWLELIAVRALVLPSLLRIISEAYAGESLPVVNDWFLHTAEHARRVPLEAYQQKATTLYLWYRWPLSAVTAAPFILLATRTFRSTLSSWWSSQSGLLTLALLAGAAAGLTAAVRVVGLSLIPLVGCLVAVRRRWSAFAIMAAYSAAAAVVCWGAWPYLRAAPLAGLREAISVMSRYPWGGSTLYMGELLKPAALPWHFVPFLVAAQLTLPALVLAAAGIGLGAAQALRNKDRLPEVLVLFAWAGGPVVAVELLNSTLYDNFRQLLFITPPLFVFAGVALQVFAQRIRSRLGGVLLAILALAPGVVGIVRLHPYEYVYYNALVGGVRGAFRSFELDYWCTSYREAMEWINNAAPPDALIAIARPRQAARHFARPDLRFVHVQTPQDLGTEQPRFGLACSRRNNDLSFFPEFRAAYEVMVDGARLAVVRDFQQPAEESNQ